MGIAAIVNSLFEIYWWIIIIRILLTWLPSIDWNAQPFALIKSLVDPLLDPFRSIIPPIGGLDISPIVALIFLQIMQSVIVQLLIRFGA